MNLLKRSLPLAWRRGLSSRVSRLDDAQRRELLQPLFAKGWVLLSDRDAIQKRFTFQVLALCRRCLVQVHALPVMSNGRDFFYFEVALCFDIVFTQNFNDSFGWMTMVALYAEKENHHPEWYVSTECPRFVGWLDRIAQWHRCKGDSAYLSFIFPSNSLDII